MSLVKSDTVLLCLDYLQLLSIILSLSLYWPWPVEWIKGTSFLLFANLDFWEFSKIHTVYHGKAQAYPDPNAIPFDYLAFCILWLVVIILFIASFILCYFAIPRFWSMTPSNSVVLRARLFNIFMFGVQISSIPFGITFIRLFDCQVYSNQETGETLYRSIVLRDTVCWGVKHCCILVPLLFVAMGYFIATPIWLLFKIRLELPTPSFCTGKKSWRNHERHLLLKEIEFMLGLDSSWATSNYSLFSSFKRPWVFFRPLSFFHKAIILSLYGGLYYIPQFQSIAIFSYLCIPCLATMLLPVFRLTVFNIILVFSLFVHLCNLLIGSLLALQVQSALLSGKNLLAGLLVINLSWLLATIVWLGYILLRNSRMLTKRFGSFWPMLSDLDPGKRLVNFHTLKYFTAMIQARKDLETCYSYPKFFTPVHQLSQQIKIINTYCREAELLGNITHSSLTTLLMEMADVHNLLAPHSLFGKLERKATYFRVVNELLAVLPGLRKRLEKREYNLCLVTPVKKRILLKLFAISVFLSGRRRREKRSVIQLATAREVMDGGSCNANTNLRMLELTAGTSNTDAVTNPLHVPHHARLLSNSIRGDDEFEEFLDSVESWERARQCSIMEYGTGFATPLQSGSRKHTFDSTDNLLNAVSRWERERRLSNAFMSDLVPRQRVLSPLLTNTNDEELPPLSPTPDHLEPGSCSRLSSRRSL